MKIKIFIILFCILNFAYFFILPVLADSSMPTFSNPVDKVNVKIPDLPVLTNVNAPKWKMPDLQISIPNMAKFSTPAPCPDDPSKMCIPWIGEYIAGIYKYAIGVVGILAAVVLMWGGLIWLSAGGSATRVTEAKSWIVGSVTGLVLVLCSYMILYEINPDLIKFKSIGVGMVEEDEKPVESISGVSGSNYCEWRLNDSKCEIKKYNAFWNEKKDEKDESECNILTKTVPLGHLSVATCCCTHWNGTWNFQKDIRQQAKDASGELIGLLNCMRRNIYGKNIGEISSISGDANVHISNSCHYAAGGSLAVDIGDGGWDKSNQINQFFVEAANKCDSNAFIDCEKDHIHISSSVCSGDSGLGNRCKK